MGDLGKGGQRGEGSARGFPCCARGVPSVPQSHRDVEADEVDAAAGPPRQAAAGPAAAAQQGPVLRQHQRVVEAAPDEAGRGPAG